MSQIQLPEDAQLFILDQDGLVFLPSTQKLYSLNTTATFFWICLEEGDDPDGCIARGAETFTLSPETARQYFDTAINSWQEIGLLDTVEGIGKNSGEPETDIDPRLLTRTDGMPDLPERDWARELRINLIGCEISIFFEKPEFLTGAQQIIGHLAVDSTDSDTTLAGSTIHVCQINDQIGVYREALPVAVFSEPGTIGPTVKSIVLQMAIDASHYQFYFHAGLLSTGDSLIMLPGEQGAGKSTLTTGLMLAGYEYFTDEVTLLDPHVPVIKPFPIALCSKASAWPLLEQRLPAMKDLPAYPRLDDKQVKYLPPPGLNPHDPAYARGLPVRYLVFPKYDPVTSTKLTSISRAEALQRLMVECLAIRSEFTADTVQLLVDWISGIDCYALPNNSLDDAIAAISQTVRQAEHHR